MTIRINNLKGKGFVRLRTGSSAAQEAYNKIYNWILWNTSTPYAEDYNALGLDQVNSGNVASVNAQVQAEDPADLDTMEKLIDFVNTILPPYFVYDTLTTVSTVALSDHAGEIGASWTGFIDYTGSTTANNIEISTDGAYLVGDSTISVYSSGTSPSAGGYAEFKAKFTQPVDANDPKILTFALTKYTGSSDYEPFSPEPGVVAMAEITVADETMATYFYVRAGSTDENSINLGSVAFTDEDFTQPFTPVADTEYIFRIEMNGPTLRFFIDGVQYAEESIGQNRLVQSLDFTGAPVFFRISSGVVVTDIKAGNVTHTSVPTPTFDITEQSSTVARGTTLTFDIDVTNFSGDLYFRSIGTAPYNALTGDIWPGFEGYVTVEPGTTLFQLPIKNTLTYIGETIQIEIYYDSVDGPFLGTSGVVTITDTGGE